jgi:hypothetical protein
MNDDALLASEILGRSLNEDEQIVWVGRPNPQRALTIDAHTLRTGIGCFILSTSIFGLTIADKTAFTARDGAFTLANGQSWALLFFYQGSHFSFSTSRR